MIKLAASQGKFIKEVEDNLDGSYSQVLQVSPDVKIKDIDITVEFKGESLSFNLEKNVQAGIEIPYFWLIVIGLVIIALIVLVWLIKK